jgi:hypothetical protein
MNFRQSYLFFGFILAILLGLHFLGIYFYFYWRVPFYDRAVHIIGSFGLTAVFGLFILSKLATKHVLLLSLGLALIFGIAWEALELHFGVTSVADATYKFDTTADIIADIAGGLGAAWYLRGKQKFAETWLEQTHN